MKKFSKAEIFSLIIIFGVLVAVSIPNFAASLRRARDQVRRDDMGSLMTALNQYYMDFGSYPLSSADGKIMNCLNPGDAPYKDSRGYWIINTIPCTWGKDAFANLITKKIYMDILPRDPNWQKGASYLFISDGNMYQLFASMEGRDEPEVDSVIAAENRSCGNQICNIGRSQGCDIPKTLQQCEEEAQLIKK